MLHRAQLQQKQKYIGSESLGVAAHEYPKLWTRSELSSKLRGATLTLQQQAESIKRQLSEAWSFPVESRRVISGRHLRLKESDAIGTCCGARQLLDIDQIMSARTKRRY